jgi:hypothetical protein
MNYVIKNTFAISNYKNLLSIEEKSYSLKRRKKKDLAKHPKKTSI